MKISSAALRLVVVLGSTVPVSAAYAQAGHAAGKTVRFWSPGHGAQVEYLGPGGRAYLWYPGNRVVVPSLRRVAMIRGIPSVCHLWPARTYNPVTRERGPGWACTPESAWAANVVEVAPGDIFGLSRSPTTPFPLPRQPLPFAQLKAGGRAL